MYGKDRPETAKSECETALEALVRSPTDAAVRGHRRYAARAFYDLADQDWIATVIGSIAGHTSNALARETKVMSNIEARVGRLKVAS